MNYLVVEIAFFILMTAGVLVSILGIPGNFIEAVIALIYLLFGKENTIELRHFILILCLSISGEVVEQLMGILGAKKFGASKKGMLGAFLGAIIGGIAGSAILPVIGTVIGVFLGCFLLTFIFEYLIEKKDPDSSIAAGVGALLGKVVAVSYKYAAGFVILIIFIIRFWIKK